MEPQEPVKVEYTEEPKIGFGNDGTIVVKNRAWRRAWKNRAMLEGKSTKKYYTAKKTKSRRKNNG